MKKKISNVMIFLIALTVHMLTEDEWASLEQSMLGLTEIEVTAKYGMPEKTGRDELLDSTIAYYRVKEGGGAEQIGEIFYSGGQVAALRRNVRGDGRELLKSFVSSHSGEILASGDLHAIAGSSGDCDLYHIIEVTRFGATVYSANGDLYRRMAAIGEAPSLPEAHGRKGYAA